MVAEAKRIKEIFHENEHSVGNWGGSFDYGSMVGEPVSGAAAAAAAAFGEVLLPLLSRGWIWQPYPSDATRGSSSALRNKFGNTDRKRSTAGNSAAKLFQTEITY